MINIEAKKNKNEFDKMDLDGDGELTLDEFSKSLPHKMDSDLLKGFDLVDVNQDGWLNYIEFAYLANPFLLPDVLKLDFEWCKTERTKINGKQYLSWSNPLSQHEGETLETLHVLVDLNYFEKPFFITGLFDYEIEWIHKKLDQELIEIRPERIQELIMGTCFQRLAINNTLGSYFEKDFRGISLRRITKDLDEDRLDKYLGDLIEIDILRKPSQYFFNLTFAFNDYNKASYSEYISSLKGCFTGGMYFYEEWKESEDK
eukprot:GHVP01059527.1.p1 GENE.GHVP01059527.1~~GHVP01059527.1.p1  ORF type:complete len:259 (+),score=42.63 GHVP01059527.1:193-969(+)